MDGPLETRLVALCCSAPPDGHARWTLNLLVREAEKVTLVCDNLNTHAMASLYEAFPAEEAHRLARRLEIHYTPRQGSWLNVAEIELSVRSGQCLDRCIGSVEELLHEIATWQRERNDFRCRVEWRFTTADARIKLAHLYPQFKSS